MDFRIETKPWHEVAADWLIVPVAESTELSGPVAQFDKHLGGTLVRLREAGDLNGSIYELLPVRGVSGIAATRLLLVGLGKSEQLTAGRLEGAFAAAARHTSEKKQYRVALTLPDESICPSRSAAECARLAATAFTVGSVGQDFHRKEPSRQPFKEVTLLASPSADHKAIEEAIERGRILGESINLTRELVNRPPNEIYPEAFAERARSAAKDAGLECEVWDEARIKQEKMGSLMAVAQGSDQPPRVIIVRYKGAKSGPNLALVGKGVTFDSGGLSLKPTDSMKTMKCDMAGAATVLGAMSAIARLKLPVNVTGYMGLVENMVSGNSFKLGDVLRARNGVTIEVLNTDAEGRLVLADVLSYAVEQGADKLIDLATLTGACMVALGEDVTGVFANDQAWADTLVTAAKSVGEDAWQLPMFDSYNELIKSDVADIKNVGGRYGGAITAAKFLEKFVNKKPWIHLDIAGPAFASCGKSYREAGATGAMLRTLVEVATRFPQLK